MKFLKLTEYKTKFPRLINFDSISDISFEEYITNITLINGRSIKVIENNSEIEQMINFSGGYIINENALNNDLPF